MREVIKAVVDRLEAEQEVLLCQVVETKGSTPQKAGALMLVDPTSGLQVGTLGGGCVEAEVKQKALRCLGQRGAELHTYVLDHDEAWADGLICGGKMTILAEAMWGEAPLGYFRRYLDLLTRGVGLTEAIRLRPSGAHHLTVGARWLLNDSGTVAASLLASPDELPKPPQSTVSGRSRPLVHEGTAWLPQPARARLLIVGAGHVGQAVAELASAVNFEVWVLDDRAQYANSERFPKAERVLAAPIETTLGSMIIDANTYVLIVTRGHGHDQGALQQVAGSAAGYVGLIGSKRKIRMIFESLRASGITDAALERVAAPVGLDIGSETVPEIAVSIVAQLIAHRNLGRSWTKG
jgi:xanthine dehydrogenase accessory factor